MSAAAHVCVLVFFGFVFLDVCKCVDRSQREGIGPGWGDPSICRGWLQILLDDTICLLAELCRQTEIIKEMLRCYCYCPAKCVNKDEMRIVDVN